MGWPEDDDSPILDFLLLLANPGGNKLLITFPIRECVLIGTLLEFMFLLSCEFENVF